MNTKGFNLFAQKVFRSIQKHSPEILMSVGIGGMITSTILAVRATPKALILLEQRKKESEEELKPLDYVKTTWKCYIPAVISGLGGAACLIFSNSVNARRNAALTTAYAISETALKEYQEKVIETIGEKKEQTVRDAIAKTKIDNNPVEKREVIITNSGDTLCYDAISGRYFKSDIEKIRKSVNELNKRMLEEMYISLNDFYYELGLEGISIGEDLGWNVNKGLIDLVFSSHLATDETPCLVIDYRVPPKYDFRHVW